MKTLNASTKKALNKALTAYHTATRYTRHAPVRVTREQALMMQWIEESPVYPHVYQVKGGHMLEEWGSFTGVYMAHLTNATASHFGHIITLCKQFTHAVDGIVKSGDHVFREVRRHGDERVYCDATVFVDI